MKVAFMHTQNNGVGYYRSWMVEKWMRRLGLAETRRYPDETPFVYWLKEQNKGDNDLPSVEEMFEWADIVHILRVERIVQVSHYEAMRDHFRNRFVVDLDDDIYNVGHDNPAYTRFVQDITETVQINETPTQAGEASLELDDGRYLNIVGNDLKYVASKQMEIANAVTVSTPALKRLYRRNNPTIGVMKNTIDLEDFPDHGKRNDGEVRIGWAGGNAHYRDLHHIWDVIVELCKRYPQVRVVLMNAPFEFMEDIPKEQVEHHDFCTIQDWPKRFCDLQFDIGIAPLLETTFNRGKSNLKWIENATQRTPTVCSAVEPFLNTVVDGKTGFVARSKVQWMSALSRLVEDAALRRRIGTFAYDDVALHWNIESYARQWTMFFEGLL